MLTLELNVGKCLGHRGANLLNLSEQILPFRKRRNPRYRFFKTKLEKPLN